LDVVGKGVVLHAQFLLAAFCEDALAGVVGFAEGVDGVKFRHGHEGNALGQCRV
jgi:hypothetical protein